MHSKLARASSLALLVWAVWLADAPSAFAQSAALDAEAHSLFEAGRTAFADGRFDDALPYFEHAYELSHRPQLLYNIGHCLDRMRHDAEAITAFERFLAEVPDAPEAAEVRARVTFLRDAQTREASTTTEASISTTEATVTADEPSTSPREPQMTAPPTSSASSGPGPAPWALIGVGGAVLVAGAVLTGVGLSDVSTVENAADGSHYAALRDAYDQAPIFTGVGFAALGLGAALAVAGVVWVVVTPSAGSGERATLRIGTDGLSLRGTF
jgi:tetratricopeptide (TPR) repeat protein